jgi:hypothetical protein
MIPYLDDISVGLDDKDRKLKKGTTDIRAVEGRIEKMGGSAEKDFLNDLAIAILTLALLKVRTPTARQRMAGFEMMKRKGVLVTPSPGIAILSYVHGFP